MGSFTSLEQLVEARLLETGVAQKLQAVSSRFRIRIPRYYAGLMAPLDSPEAAQCPIRLQALPQLTEDDPALPAWATEWSLKAFGRAIPWISDPIGDVERLGALRLTHRYENRAILHVSSLCALYCRFCFRKSHLNEKEKLLYEGSLDPALSYLKSQPQVEELILTGGDPLSMNDVWFERFLEKVSKIPQIKHLRIHSRMAVTLPSRLTETLAQLLSDKEFSVALVSHFNHAKELTPTALSKLSVFRKKGITLYNQTVLMRGVNNTEVELRNLFQSLYNHGVTPFYLHHADLTPGTFAFRTSVEEGQRLMRGIQGKLSGPAVPHYVLDLPGGLGKVPLLSDRVQKLEEKQDVSFGGALYTVAKPHTRMASNTPTFYFDFFPR